MMPLPASIKCVNIFDACFSFYLQIKFSFTSSLQSIYINDNLC